MKKLLVMLLALIMVLSMFVACNNDKPEPEESKDPAGESSSQSGGDQSTPSDSSSSSSTPDPEVDLYEVIGLPDDLNYNDGEVTFVNWDEQGQKEFNVSAEELDGDPIADAVYKRNLYTEQLLGVKLNFVHNQYFDNSLPAMNEWCDIVENMMSDPATPVDVIASYSRVLSVATVRGLNQDLMVFENLDFEKPWWPQTMVADYSMKDKLFTITGDLAPSMLTNIYAIFFNRNLAEQYGVGDLVQKVKDYEWTVDYMIESTKNLYQDLDDVEGLSAGDQMGAWFDYWHLDPVIQGAGFKLIEDSDEDGVYLKVTDDYYSESFGNFIGKLTDWGKTDDIYIDMNYTGGSTGIFEEGRSLYISVYLYSGFYFQEADIEYGVLPMPLLDPEAQNNTYVTTLANTYSLYSICRATRDGERAAAVLNTLGYYGLELCTPAVYDVTFKGKFSKEEDMLDMLDLIKSSVGFDNGLLYMRYLNGINDTPCMAVGNGRDWSVVMGPLQQKALNKSADKLNIMLEDAMNA